MPWGRFSFLTLRFIAWRLQPRREIFEHYSQHVAADVSMRRMRKLWRRSFRDTVRWQAKRGTVRMGYGLRPHPTLSLPYLMCTWWMMF